MHEKGQKGEENIDVISSPQKNNPRAFWLHLQTNHAWMAEKKKKIKNNSAPQEGKRQNQLNQPADRRERRDTDGQTRKHANLASSSPANEAEREKV